MHRWASSWWLCSRHWYNHRRRGDFLPVNLPSVHVFHRVFCIVGGLVLDVRVTASDVRMHMIFGELNVLDLTVHGKYLEEVVLVNGAC